MIRDQCHADARCHLQALAVEEHRFREQLTKGVGQFAYLQTDFIARALKATEQHHEFIAAQARHRIFQAHAGFEPRRDDLQYCVTDRMAE